MRRGWTSRYKYLSERKQQAILIEAGVAERVIYGAADWEPFVRALRPGDEAVVADLRVFGSRKALGKATAEVEAREATLVTAARDVRIHPPTLREAHEAERKWAGERSMGSRKRAKELSGRGHDAYRAKLKASRMAVAEFEARWRDVDRYPTRADAVSRTGWTIVTAWREFGPREKKR